MQGVDAPCPETFEPAQSLQKITNTARYLYQQAIPIDLRGKDLIDKEASGKYYLDVSASALLTSFTHLEGSSRLRCGYDNVPPALPTAIRLDSSDRVDEAPLESEEADEEIRDDAENEE